MYQTLQVFRGLAAVGVAAFHLSIVLGDPAFGGNGTYPFWSVTRVGYLGVDFFFVLSGFIILQAHQRDIGHAERAGNYLARRAIRILPIYWVYLIVVIAGMIAVGSSHLRLQTSLDWLTVFSLVRMTPVELPLSQAWTLFHEVVFYLLFGALVLHKRIGMALLLVWLAAIALHLGEPPAARQTFMTTLLGAHNINFFLGMLAFLAVRKMTPQAGWGCLLASVGLFAATLAAQPQANAPAWWQLGYGLSFAFAIAGAVALERAGALRVPALLALIGDASYSLYLLHEHSETYLVRGLAKLGWRQADQPAATFAIVLLATVAIGCLAYIAVERPLLRALRLRVEQRSSPRDPKTAA